MFADEIPMYRLYGELTHLWPVMSPPEEYAEAAEHWRTVLRQYLGEGRHRLLELGVGGGHHLSQLTKDFDAVAADIAEPMLTLSRHLNPSVEHCLGDMRSMRMAQTFSAVTIHDAVSHLLSEDEIRQTLATAAAHLEPGGLLLAAPDYFADDFSPPQITLESREAKGIRLDYVEYVYRPCPNEPWLETVFTYMIHEKGTLRIEHDRMHTGLFPLATWERLFIEAGFQFQTHRFTLSHWPRDYLILAGVLEKRGRAKKGTE
jgi:hypothetical protein